MAGAFEGARFGARIGNGLDIDNEEFLKLRQRFPSLRTSYETKLRTRKGRLEQLIKILEPQGRGQSERKELAMVYAELRKFSSNPLYKASQSEIAKYQEYRDIQAGIHGAGAGHDIDVSSFGKATREGRIHGFPSQNVRTRGGSETTYIDATKRIGDALGVRPQDVPKLIGGLDSISKWAQGGGQAVAAPSTKTLQAYQKKQAEEQERLARLQRPGTVEHGLAAVKRNVPEMKPGEERAVRIFLEGAGGKDNVPRQAVIDAIQGAKAGKYSALRSVGATNGALRDPKALVETVLKAGFHVGHLLQGAHSTRNAGVSEAMLVMNAKGQSVLYGDALIDLSKRTGFSTGELQKLFAGKSSLKGIYGLLKEIAAEQFAGENNRGISDRALAYGEQRGTLGNDFFTGVRKHTIRNNRDLHLIGDGEAGWRYISQGFNDPTGTLLSSVDPRSPEELEEWEKVLRFGMNFLMQSAVTGATGKLFTAASKGLSAVPKVGSLLEKGASRFGAFTNPTTVGGTLLKGGAQQIGGMIPDTVIQSRIDQNTTGKDFLKAFGEAGVGQLKELVSTKYLTGVDENGNPIKWGDRVVGGAQQFLALVGAAGMTHQALKAGNVNVRWPKEWLEAKARQYKVDVPVLKGMLDKAVGEVRGVLSKPLGKQRPKTADSRGGRYGTGSHIAERTLNHIERQLVRSAGDAEVKGARKAARSSTEMIGMIMQSRAARIGISVDQAIKKYGEKWVAKAVEAAGVPVGALHQSGYDPYGISELRTAETRPYVTGDVLDKILREFPDQFPVAFTIADRAMNDIYHDPDSGTTFRAHGGPLFAISRPDFYDPRDGIYSWANQGNGAVSQLLRASSKSKGIVAEVAGNPYSVLGSHGNRALFEHAQQAVLNGAKESRVVDYLNAAIDVTNRRRAFLRRPFSGIDGIAELNDILHPDKSSFLKRNEFLREAFAENNPFFPDYHRVAQLLTDQHLINHDTGDIMGLFVVDPDRSPENIRDLVHPSYRWGIPGLNIGLTGRVPFVELFNDTYRSVADELMIRNPERWSMMSPAQRYNAVKFKLERKGGIAYARKERVRDLEYGLPHGEISPLALREVKKDGESGLLRGLSGGGEADRVATGRKSSEELGESLPSDAFIQGRTRFQASEGGIKGAFQYRPPTAQSASRVRLFFTKGKADASTILHEAVGHFMFEVLDHGEKISMARAMGFDKIDVPAIEQFVRHFERYVREGKAPNSRLESAFRNFRIWLREIYVQLKGSPLENKIPQEVRAKFDELLGGHLPGGKDYTPWQEHGRMQFL